MIATTRRSFVLWFLSILVFAMWNSVPSAQVGTAALSGEVTDSSSAVLPGVSVTVTNTQTSVQFTAVTNQQGRYSIPSLPVGTYDVTTELQGFDKSVQKGLQLGVGQQARLDVQLRVGAVSETLTVTANALLVETTNASLGARVSGTQIEGLPLNGRNFDQLSWLAPGVNQVSQSSTAGSAATSTFGRGASYSFAGLRPEGQVIMLDGADLQGFWGRGSGSTLAGTSLGIEAVGEYQVLTNTYGAQFSGFGAVVNSVTKSGTNKFHGSGYEFYRNSKLDSKNYFDTGNTPPPFHRNQYGLSLGGPIRESKAFFFGNFEGLNQSLSSTVIGFVPDDNARNGLLPCSALTVVPASCNRTAPTLVNVGVSPIVAPYLALWPAANGAATGDGRARLTSVITAPTEDYYLNGRADFVLSNADNLMVRYIHDRATFYSPKPGSPVGGYGTNGDGRNQFLTIQERKVFSSTMVNTANFNVTQTNQTVTPESTGASAPLLNFMNVASLPSGSFAGGFGLAAIGADRLNPIFTKVTSYQVSDAVSWVKGAHSLNFGGNVNHVVTLYDMPAALGGQYTFNTLNDFLVGKAFQFTGVLASANNASRTYTEIRAEPYIQDDWRVAKPLTLNLGLRWDFMTNPTEKDGLLYTLPDPLKSTALVQVPNVYKKNPTLTNFNPRVGFAWTPFDDQKTAIRGGAGRYNFLLTARTYGLGYARAGTWVMANVTNPPFPNGASLLAATPPIANQAIDYTDNFTTGYAWTYNVNLQREIYPGGIASIGYLGSRGEHMPGAINLNTPVSVGTTAAGQVLRRPGAPLQNPAFGSLQYIEDVGISRYNAVQLSLTGRARNIQYLVAYDLSSCKDNLSASYAAAPAGTAGQSSYSEGTNPNWDYGRCDFQATHSGKGTIVYLFPWNGNRLVSGWQTSLIAQMRSGLPLSPNIGFDIANLQVGCGGCRPDLVAGANSNPVLGDPNKWFDPTAFTLATIPAGTYGSLPRNTIDGPGLMNFDLSVQKETVLVGDAKVQLRVDVFNLFNRANFGVPNTTVFTSASGVPSPTAGLITTTSTPSRQMQLSVRFVF